MKPTRLLRLLLPCLSLPCALAQAEPYASRNDFGLVGLLQTPSARMAPAGELAVSANRVEPYSRYSFALQPFDWLETAFRYTSISDRRYGPEDFSGGQSYKDKAVDAKLRLLQETRWTPQLALGAMDLGGTGLFSSEYLVGSKRLGDFDLSLGLAWGYLGNRGDLDNPLGWLDDKYDHRPKATGTGDFGSNAYFRGAPSPFAGVLWQTPWERLSLKLEYDGNDYRHEPLDNPQPQDSPLNFGAVFKAADAVDLSVGWERGNTAMFGITLHTNFATRQAPAKTYDPPPEALPARTPDLHPEQVDWAGVSRRLRDNAGYRVDHISRRDAELVVYGEQTDYLYAPKAVGRAARILDNSVGDGIDYFTLVDERYAMPVTETSVPRQTFREVLNHDRPLADLRRATEQNPPARREEQVLYRQRPDPFSYSLGLGYKQNVGGPDGFLLYQFSADLDAEYRFTPDLWWSGALSANLLNNFDKFKYDAPSNLPRVRTHLREYWTTSDVTLPSFQLNKAERLDQDLYGMLYGGYLEAMYAGVGGELLYRPQGERWALGANLDYVRQRAFAQDFGLRDYRVLSGHLTGYLKTDFQDLLAAVSVGRYLARDWGTTLDLSREFSNGVRFGGWLTLTSASKQEYGEGSFDKGLYVSIPFDELMSRSTMRRANLAWAPLTRDGGAKLQHTYSLYELTEGRNPDLFNGSFAHITE
ncbi:YjbH domain-containing protein [Pseudomonas citronellolis]|uniref:YjbH domain-containing protein n=1 Tax=Pseudomonas citronellolis TaxID=53408 RepID=UPI0023E42364|nr:YjbH domain-containing protein [Pseudomonas citronellolis]MDF3932272.1 YjbH domain-containing protein [Pseudomonas citronellolis]